MKDQDRNWPVIKEMLADIADMSLGPLRDQLQEKMIEEATKLEPVWMQNVFLENNYDKKAFSNADRPAGIPRTDNGLERGNRHMKESDGHEVVTMQVCK